MYIVISAGDTYRRSPFKQIRNSHNTVPLTIIHVQINLESNYQAFFRPLYTTGG